MCATKSEKEQKKRLTDPELTALVEKYLELAPWRAARRTATRIMIEKLERLDWQQQQRKARKSESNDKLWMR
jgi:hypothetical protein